MSKKYKKVAVFYNETKQQAKNILADIGKILKSHKAQGFFIPSHKYDRWPGNADLVIALGGDGTVLHAARDMGGKKIPLLGINVGSLGFLSGIEAKEIRQKLPDVLQGKFHHQRKYLIEAKIRRGSEIIGPYTAFNDCVIKTLEPRIMQIRAEIDSKFLINYSSDGFIVSTPAGSTAYALAAGGPIVFPGLDVFVLVPICPHTLTHRPIIVSTKRKITVKPIIKSGDGFLMPILSIDGQTDIKLFSGDEILIQRSKKYVNLLVPRGYDYFKVLSHKLKWGQR